eukprot:jgi/Chlat1/8148/Chrsp76S00608
MMVGSSTAAAGKLQFAAVLGCVASLLLLTPVFGLYEDQIGHIDWHQQHIGKVTTVLFPGVGSRKRVVVATEQSVLATLNLRDASIVWRQVFAEHDPIDKVLLAKKTIVSISSHGQRVRAWSLLDGALIWEHLIISTSDLHVQPSHEDAVLITLDDGTDALSVLAGGSIQLLSLEDGAVKWSTGANVYKSSYSKLIYAEELKRLYASGFVHTEPGSVQVLALDVVTGKTVSSNTVTAKLSLLCSQLVAVNSTATLLAVAADGGHVVTLDLSKTPTFVPHDLATQLGASTSRLSLLPAVISGGFAIKVKGSDKGAAIFKLVDGVPKLLYTAPQGAVITDELVVEDQTAVAAVFPQQSGIEYEVISVSDGTVLANDAVEVDISERGRLEAAFLNSYPRRQGTGQGFRVWVVHADYSSALLQQGQVIWSLEEALAAVTDVKIIDLPTDHVVAKKGLLDAVKEFVEDFDVDSITNWAYGHYLSIKNALHAGTPEEVESLREYLQATSENNKMTRDANGFRKLIITLTEAEQLLALHTGNGRIVWSAFYGPGSSRCATCSELKLKKLLLWRAHASHKGNAPQVLVIGETPSTNTACLLWLDAHTGRELRSQTLPYRVKHVIQLPYYDTDDQSLLLLVDSTGRAHLFPETEEAADIVAPRVGAVYYYDINEATGILTGYALTALPGRDKLTFGSLELWQVAFPSNMKIAAVASRRSDEVAASRARVKGDHSVLYKYLNPNTLFVATTTSADAVAAGIEPHVTAYILDTVTGAVLYQTTHAQATGPVNAMLSENFVVYNLFDVNAHRHQVAVFELFDESAESTRTISELMATTSVQAIVKQVLNWWTRTTPATQSSLVLPKLRVFGQSYFFPETIKTLAVTTTARGITSKLVLIGTGSDQVLGMSKKLLDPRRPLVPTNQDKEEGLLPYADKLPVQPQAYATHKLQVAKLKNIVTVPARLESTCLMFAHGIDIFFNRLAPSKTYDLLTDDFNYALLVLTIISLLIALVVTSYLNRKQDLKKRWN